MLPARTLNLLLTGLVAVVSLAVTAWLVRHEQRQLDATLRTSFELGLRQAASRIEQRVASFELALRGAQGLFDATGGAVDAASFEAYVDALLAGADATGLQGIGQADAPPPEGPDRAPLKLVAPRTGTNTRSIGFDLLGDPLRRQALLQARDGGGIAITRKLRLSMDTPDAPAASFLMVLPLYAGGAVPAAVGERRRAHRGWVAAAYRMNDLMASLYGELTPGLALTVHDGVLLDEASLMYRSHAEPAPGVVPRFAAQEYIGFAGHTWTLSVRTLPAFDDLHNLDGPRTILVAGIGLSLLLAWLTWLLASGRERAHAVARAMTRELRESEARLRESQKMEAIGTLAGGIAHDFNNILAAILGHAELARDGAGRGQDVAPHLAQIRQAAAHARSLVQQIVAFSRRQPLTRVAQPLQPLLQASARLLRAMLPAAVDLQVHAAAAPLWARVDATQLQQVLMNLCTNAWQALPDGVGRIELGLQEQWLDEPAAQAVPGLRPGPHARLWVADNGSGIAAEALPHIFEPFYTTKPVGQGTGLGLAVVHGIVSAHEGGIVVSSTPGAGARFDLYLPLVAAEPAPAAEPGPGPLHTAGGRGERLIYLDDDAVMVTLMEALLQQAGYQVRGFTDAREALAALRAAPADVDLLITDYNMPALSGLDVVQALRDIRPALPVIISSGFLSDAIRAAAHAAGVRHLLQKEYSTERLVPLVRQALDEAAA